MVATRGEVRRDPDGVGNGGRPWGREEWPQGGMNQDQKDQGVAVAVGQRQVIDPV